jgi:hypothetical protein
MYWVQDDKQVVLLQTVPSDLCFIALRQVNVAVVLLQLWHVVYSTYNLKNSGTLLNKIQVCFSSNYYFYYLFHNIILVVIFHLEVKRYVYVVVCVTGGKHTCSCIISLHHIALHIIRGCRRIFVATVPVQHHTLPEEGYDAASYLVGYGGSGHGICIAFVLIVVLYISYMHWYECGYEDLIIWSKFKQLRFILLFIWGWLSLYHVSMFKLMPIELVV